MTAHFIRPGPQHRLEVVDAADAAADRQRDKNLFGGFADDVRHRPPVLVGGGNVEEDDLVRPLAVVFLGTLHRVADLFDADEVDTLDDLPVPNVETGDDPFIQHPLTPLQSRGLPGAAQRPLIEGFAADDPVEAQFPHRPDILRAGDTAAGDDLDAGVFLQLPQLGQGSGPVRVPSREISVKHDRLDPHRFHLAGQVKEMDPAPFQPAVNRDHPVLRVDADGNPAAVLLYGSLYKGGVFDGGGTEDDPGDAAGEVGLDGVERPDTAAQLHL